MANVAKNSTKGKMLLLAHISETKAFRANLTVVKLYSRLKCIRPEISRPIWQPIVVLLPQNW